MCAASKNIWQDMCRYREKECGAWTSKQIEGKRWGYLDLSCDCKSSRWMIANPEFYANPCDGIFLVLFSSWRQCSCSPSFTTKMNPLDDYTFSGSLSSRSSTPGEPHHSFNMSHSTTSGSSMFQGAEEWISSSPASDPAPLASLTPNPFRYNQQKALSFHPECRQCIVLKRENLVLLTENATLKCVH